ncbi:MAG: RNA polymerase factor sigma-32, partial [Elusimicrobia bacterium]|nr:RNA polymerase factor sigma-32 [Elusimicrobiota bacterium]
IKAAINDYILRSWSLVKIGTVAAQKKLFYNLSRIKAKLGIYENKELEPQVVKQIAHELMVDEKDVTEMNRRIGGDSSLNVNIGDDEDGREKLDMVIDSRENIEGKLANKEEYLYKAKILKQCLQTLDTREQYIVKRRMLTDTPSTLDEIGAHFNISRERVRQIEKRAFEKQIFY